MRRVDVVADHLQREIGLHAGAHVEGAFVEQRPAAMLALDAAQIDRDRALELGIDRLGQVMTKQHVFGRDRRVGLELEAPVAVGLLGVEQRLGCPGDFLIERRAFHLHAASTTSLAARLPERVAPSSVAGNPVAVPSPARNRLSLLVRAPGRFAFSAGVAAKVARRSRTICHGGSAGAIPVVPMPVALATSFQMVWASSSRGTFISRSAALIVTERRPSKAKIHSVVALIRPCIGGTCDGASILKCALAMAR